jgi:hypothetical protein
MRNLTSFGALVLSVAGHPAMAQESSATIPPGLAVGVTVDRFDVDQEYGYSAVTLHVSGLKPNNLSSEFAFSIFPRFLLVRQLVTNIDVGAAFNVTVPHAALLIRGGASGLFALGGGSVALPGVHIGASLLIKVDEKSAFRFDVIRRVFYSPDRTGTPSLTVGAGFTVLPGIR